MTESTKAPKTIEGIRFKPKADGKTSTMGAGKKVFAHAVETIDPARAAAIRKEKNWRKNYVQHVAPLTELAIREEPAAFTMAERGLEAIQEQLEFIRDKKAYRLSEAMETLANNPFVTICIEGAAAQEDSEGSAPEHFPQYLPYKNGELRGLALRRQVQDWVERGIVNHHHGTSLNRTLARDAAIDLSDQTFVLLGGGSEIGPLRWLLEWGANVIVIDLPGSHHWPEMIKMARHSKGRLYVPLAAELYDAYQRSEDQDAFLATKAGANLLSQTPEIAAWISAFDRPMTVGHYAYLDSSWHVLVVAAMDAISQRLIANGLHIQLAFLMTPTDVYAIPGEDALEVLEDFNRPGLSNWCKKAIAGVSRNRFFAQNIRTLLTSDAGIQYGIVNNIISHQGPNYILAKRLQRWRAIEARAKGIMVSCNIAPSAATVSVMKNKLFAAGFAGIDFFGGEIFCPVTASALMAAQLVDDLTDPGSSARPDFPLHNPEELFIYGANHGGFWSLPHQIGSMLEIGVGVGFVRQIFAGSTA